MTNFQKSLKIGKRAEAQVYYHLHHEKKQTLVDVSGYKEYQEKDIDYIIHRQNGKPITLEIKHDSKLKYTKNIFIETAWDRKTGRTAGWGKYCEADLICFYDMELRRGYIFDWKKLKEYAKEFGEKRSFFTKIDNCTGYCTLVPLEQAKKFLVYEWGTENEIQMWV